MILVAFVAMIVPGCHRRPHPGGFGESLAPQAAALAKGRGEPGKGGTDTTGYK